MRTARSMVIRTFAGLCVLWALTGRLPADSTWTGGGSDSNWTTSANWDAAPASGASLIFGTGGSYANQDVDFTAGLVTFNRAGGFTIGSSAANKTLTLNTGITVSATESYNVWRAGGNNPAIDVAGGGKVVTSNTYFNGFAKTGAGEYGCRAPNGYWGYYNGGATVKEGTVTMWKNTYGYSPWFNSLTVSNGAKAVSTDNGSIAINGGGRSTILGKIGDSGTPLGVNFFAPAATGIVVFGGTEGKITGPANAYWAMQGGTVILSNLTDNVADRIRQDPGSTVDFQGGRIVLLGNDSADSAHQVNFGRFSDWGIPTLEIRHGANANAWTTNKTPRSWLQGKATFADQGEVIKVVANDLGAASGYRSYVEWGKRNSYGGWGTFDNAPYAGLSVLPWTWVASGEFASYDDARGLKAYDGLSRLASLGAATSNDDVSIGSGQTLGGNAAAQSLKIDGACTVNLNGNTLTLGNYGYGGALLQTGADNNGGITNGTLATQGTAKHLFVQGDKALTVSAAVNAAGIVKFGPGKLTLTGPLNLTDAQRGHRIRWLEGTLELNVTNDILFADSDTRGYGTDANASLIKKGTNTLALDATYYNMSTGGVTVAEGTMVGGRFGYGQLAIQQGAMAVLSNSAFYFVPSKVLLDGGTLYTRGGWGYPSYSALFGSSNLRGGSPPVFEVPAGKTGTVYMAKDDLTGTGPGDNIVHSLAGVGSLRFSGPGRALFFGQIAASPFTGVVRIGPQATVAINYYAGWQNPKPWDYWPSNAVGYFLEATNSVLYKQYGNDGVNGGPVNGLFTYSGFGHVKGNNGVTFACGGGRWAPGDGKTAGILNVDMNLALTKLNGTNCVVDIDLTGAGSTPGTDNDELVVDNLGQGGAGWTGLNANPANSAADLIVRTNPKKRGIGTNVYTIVKAPNNLQGLQFGAVTWATPGSFGTVNYNTNGTITLTGVYGGYTLEGTTFIMR